MKTNSIIYLYICFHKHRNKHTLSSVKLLSLDEKKSMLKNCLLKYLLTINDYKYGCDIIYIRNIVSIKNIKNQS